MARRFETLEDIAWRGLRLRVWCYACARSSELDAGDVLRSFAAKEWPLDLVAARARFRCRRCRSVDDVLILPASPLPPPPPPPPERERTWAQEVEAFFHGSRKKKRREFTISPDIMARLRARLDGAGGTD